MSPRKTVATAARRLTAADWEEAALRMLARRGLDAVAVEPLARDLKVSKGSFYWHFPNRNALVTAVLRRWRWESVDSIIDRMNAVRDPRERLLRLVELAIREPLHGERELAVAGAFADRAVARAFRSALDARLEFLSQMFSEMGFSPASAKRRALIAYTMFVGFYQMLRLAPEAAAGPVGPLIREFTAALEAPEVWARGGGRPRSP
jgi:AcrR family transcriptional regulator